MTEPPVRNNVIAVLRPCEQYRFKVGLPGAFGKATRVAMRRRALREATETFLECSRNYQAVGWTDLANLAFADTRTAPSDSKSEFLHVLTSIKLIQLSVEHFRAGGGGDGTRPVLQIGTSVTWAIRRMLGKLCESLDIEIRNDVLPAGVQAKPKIGGSCRPNREKEGAFVLWPIKRFEDFRTVGMRRLTAKAVRKRCFNRLMQVVILFLWPLPIASRVVFSMIYQLMAIPVLRRLDGPRNVFVYFDLRLGKNRDVASYLRWKFGDLVAACSGQTPITFSHLARPGQAYSFAAMAWAFKALRRMRSHPLEGCVTVNYLLPGWPLLTVRLRRHSQRRLKRRHLRELIRQAPDFLSRHVYEEFIASLNLSSAFPMEVSRSYERFFGLMSPGVVIQADAAAKTARHFTVCAHRRGGRVIYVADRICTSLRTSNQFLRDGGDNPQIPDRCIVFDQVSREEFIRQGIAAERVHVYHRNFAVGRQNAASENAEGSQVVILLQAYEDNIEAMVRVGTDILDSVEGMNVIYQEHPNFPLCDRMKESLREAYQGRLRFLAPGEPVDYGRTLALVTGYSTAAVPGVMLGVPLIWLRKQIDNSIFGEAYLDRIGFAADWSSEVISLLGRLREKDTEMLAACAVASREAREIFVPSCGREGTLLADALSEAFSCSFADIAADAANRPLQVPGTLEPLGA
ncbi:MAG: hypothetical protein EOP88_05455 [Verrucomicrobiaceae bacterium]|nr:MAG: hypothetical protein EOP88_05455 [Verrucomicrobiaceae bacterium]